MVKSKRTGKDSLSNKSWNYINTDQSKRKVNYPALTGEVFYPVFYKRNHLL